MLILRSAATWLYLLIRGWPVRMIRGAFCAANLPMELDEAMEGDGSGRYIDAGKIQM
jgi:hypothetical protein